MPKPDEVGDLPHYLYALEHENGNIALTLFRTPEEAELFAAGLRDPIWEEKAGRGPVWQVVKVVLKKEEW